MLTRLLVGLCLLHFALAEADTIIKFDYDESIMQGKTLQRVERVVDVNTTLVLVCCHIWSKFQDMGVFFDLPYPQYIKAAYAINWGSSYACVLAARLMIDGKEDRFFRTHVAHVDYPSVRASGEIYLPAGRHEAVVEYRTDCNYKLNPFDSDWPLAAFKLSYFKIVPSS